MNADGDESQKQTLSKERASTGRNDRKINMSSKRAKYVDVKTPLSSTSAVLYTKTVGAV